VLFALVCPCAVACPAQAAIHDLIYSQARKLVKIAGPGRAEVFIVGHFRGNMIYQM
jgi:hypothetical protein